MKRSLVLGCAVLALAAGSSAASAQGKFELTVGGDAFFQGAIVDQDQDSGLRATELRNRFRVVITPSATADNGLQYGARLRIRADNANRTLTQDRSYIFVKGGFGTVQAGTINGLSDEYGLIGPNVEGIAGGPDNLTLDFVGGASANLAARTQNFRNMTSGNAATRLVYLTPVFAGFQGGLSYMPKSDDAQNSINRRKYSTVTAFGSQAPSFQDVGEVGGIYTRELGPVTLDATAFYEFGSATKETTGTVYNGFKALSSWNAGVNVGFSGVKVGAMYRNAGKSGYCKASGCGGADQESWIVGANYTMGSFIFAANYQSYKDAGDPSVRGDSKMDLYQAGVTYAVAPGLSAGLEYSYFKARENDTTAVVRDKGSIIMLDTRLAF